MTAPVRRPRRGAWRVQQSHTWVRQAPSDALCGCKSRKHARCDHEGVRDIQDHLKLGTRFDIANSTLEGGSKDRSCHQGRTAQWEFLVVVAGSRHMGCAKNIMFCKWFTTSRRQTLTDTWVQINCGLNSISVEENVG